MKTTEFDVWGAPCPAVLIGDTVHAVISWDHKGWRWLSTPLSTPNAHPGLYYRDGIFISFDMTVYKARNQHWHDKDIYQVRSGPRAHVGVYKIKVYIDITGIDDDLWIEVDNERNKFIEMIT